MSTLVQRARAYAPLAPWERALLKLAEGVVIAGLVATIPVLITQIQSGHVDWMAVWPVFAVAALTALLKLFTAQGDPPLPIQPPAS